MGKEKGKCNGMTEQDAICLLAGSRQQLASARRSSRHPRYPPFSVRLIKRISAHASKQQGQQRRRRERDKPTRHRVSQYRW